MELFKVKLLHCRISVTCKSRKTVIKQLHHLESKSVNFRVYIVNQQVAWISGYVLCKRSKFSIDSKLREKEIVIEEKIIRYVGINAEGYVDQHWGYELGIRCIDINVLLKSAPTNINHWYVTVRWWKWKIPREGL